MKYNKEEEKCVMDSIYSVMVKYPEIDEYIYKLQQLPKRKRRLLTITQVKNLKDYSDEFIDSSKIKKRIVVNFFCYCLYKYCGTKDIFNKSLRRIITNIERSTKTK